MTKFIDILTLRPEVEAQQVLEVLPDLGDVVLSHVFITALVSPNEPFKATREFMFETTDERIGNDSALISLQVYNLLVSNLRLGQMRSFQSVGIGVRRPDSGQGRGTVEVLDRVK